MAWNIFGFGNKKEGEVTSITPKQATEPAEPNGLTLRGFSFALLGNTLPRLTLLDCQEVLAKIFIDYPEPATPQQHHAPTGDNTHGTLVQGLRGPTVYVAFYHQASKSTNTYKYDNVHFQWINPQQWIDNQKIKDFDKYYQEEYEKITPQMLMDEFALTYKSPAFKINDTFEVGNTILWDNRYTQEWQEETRGKLAETAANMRIAQTNWAQRFEQVMGEKPVKPENKNFVCAEFTMYLRIHQSGGRPAWEHKVVRRSELTQEAYEDGKGKAHLKWIAETPTLLKQMWDKPLINDIRRLYNGAEHAPQFIPKEDVITGSMALVPFPDQNPSMEEVLKAATLLTPNQQLVVAKALFDSAIERNPSNEDENHLKSSRTPLRMAS